MLTTADPNLTTTVIAATGYRIFTIIAGVALCWMGYKLFEVGIFVNAGDAEGKWGNKRIILKRAAPGTFFALFGAIVLGLAVYKGLNIDVHALPSATLAPGQAANSSGDAVTPNVNSSLIPMISMPATSKVDPIFAKVTKGRSLTDDERKQLANWYKEQKQFETTFHIQVRQEFKGPGAPTA